MSRERVARFKARFKDPDLRKKVQNAYDYRHRKRWPDHEILAYLVREFGHYLPDYDFQTDGSSALQTDPLNSETDAESDTEGEENDVLNSAVEAESVSADILNLPPEFQEKEITQAEIAAMIERMQSLTVSHLHHYGEGVVIEMPATKRPTETSAEIQPEAEPAPGKDSADPQPEEVLPAEMPKLNSVRRIARRKLNSAGGKAEGKTAETNPMRPAPQPSPTRTVFSTVALLALIGFMAHYLISATAALYGTGVAVLLVLIPLALVFFVKVPIVRYSALALFLAADLLSVKALHEKEVAKIAVASLDSHPEYQRLRVQYQKAEVERDGINPDTHPTLRNRKVTELKKISDRMTEIESTSRVSEQAAADKTQADVILGVRALLLLGAAIFAHALLHYSAGIDYDGMMRKAFGRDPKA